MRLVSTFPAGLVAVVTATAAAAFPAQPAQADDLDDCPYPSVCLYRWDDSGWHRTGQFRQFTRGWQYLTVSRGAQTVVNTRDDDVVYVLHLDGVIGCFPADNTRGGEIAPIIALRISPSPVCQL